MRPVFAPFGMIEHFKMIPHKNCMFVTYTDKQDAWRCLTELTQRPVLFHPAAYVVVQSVGGLRVQ